MGGRLTGLAVAATNLRLVAVPAYLVRRHVRAISIPYEKVVDFAAGVDCLVVQSDTETISLVKCAPHQVAALVAELKTRVPSQAE